MAEKTILIEGPRSSGKTTIANTLRAGFEREGKTVQVFDDFDAQFLDRGEAYLKKFTAGYRTRMAEADVVIFTCCPFLRREKQWPFPITQTIRLSRDKAGEFEVSGSKFEVEGEQPTANIEQPTVKEGEFPPAVGGLDGTNGTEGTNGGKVQDATFNAQHPTSNIQHPTLKEGVELPPVVEGLSQGAGAPAPHQGGEVAAPVETAREDARPTVAADIGTAKGREQGKKKKKK